jgi:hypothetical protein
MLRVVSDLKTNYTQNLSNLIITGPSIQQLDLYFISVLRGRINLCSEILETKEFLSILTEEEVKDDIKSHRSESID